MRYLLLFMILLTSAGCYRRPPGFYDERVLVQANTEDLSKIIWDYTIELKHTKRLRLENSYVMAGDGFSVIRFQFSSQDLLEVGPARQLLVDVVEGFLKKLNESTVAKELIPYPFDANHLEVYIDFESFHGLYVDPFFVGWMVLECGNAYYYAFTLKDDERDFWHSRIEPYEKSRSYVQFEREAEANYLLLNPKPLPALSKDRYMGKIVP